MGKEWSLQYDSGGLKMATNLPALLPSRCDPFPWIWAFLQPLSPVECEGSDVMTGSRLSHHSELVSLALLCWNCDLLLCKNFSYTEACSFYENLKPH